MCPCRPGPFHPSAAGGHAGRGSADETRGVQPAVRRQSPGPAHGVVPQQPHKNTARDSGEVGHLILRAMQGGGVEKKGVLIIDGDGSGLGVQHPLTRHWAMMTADDK